MCTYTCMCVCDSACHQQCMCIHMAGSKVTSVLYRMLSLKELFLGWSTCQSRKVVKEAPSSILLHLEVLRVSWV